MKDYKGPKTFMELSAWHANRLPFKNERLGQAFYNDFEYQVMNSYHEVSPDSAFNQLVIGLQEIYPDFWEGVE